MGIWWITGGEDPGVIKGGKYRTNKVMSCYVSIVSIEGASVYI